MYPQSESMWRSSLTLRLRGLAQVRIVYACWRGRVQVSPHRFKEKIKNDHQLGLRER